MRVTVSPLAVLPFFFLSLSSLYLLVVKCKGLLLQLITVNNTQLVRLLWTRVWPEAATSTWQHTTQTSITPAGFEPAVPTNERSQTYALVRTATGIGWLEIMYYIFFMHFTIRRRIHSAGGQDGVVCTASCCGLDCPGFELHWGQDISSCPYRPRGPPDFIYNGHWACFLGVKRPARVINHQSPSNSEAEIALSCTLTPLVCMLWTGLYREILLVQY